MRKTNRWWQSALGVRPRAEAVNSQAGNTAMPPIRSRTAPARGAKPGSIRAWRGAAAGTVGLSIYLLVSLFVAAPSAQAAFPGQNGRIVFSSGNGNPELGVEHRIFTMNPDGTAKTQLTSGNIDTQPAFSRDGKKIAFRRNNDIWVMNADGSDLIQLTDGSGGPLDPILDEHPTFSPDGDQIAFVRGSEQIHLYVMNADGSPNPDGSKMTRVGAPLDTAGAGEPEFSPSGTQIVFQRVRASGTEIYTINVDGSGLTQLTKNLAFDAEPSYSPDGTRIAWFRTNEPAGQRDFGATPGQIYMMDALDSDGDGNGQNMVQVTKAPSAEATADNHPVFSPDGSKIAFSRSATNSDYCPCQGDIYTVKLDGSDEQNLTPLTAVNNMEPYWAPAVAGPPPLSISDVTVTEGDSGTTEASFVVSRSGSTAQPASVGYATADDSAVAPGDYTAESGTVSLAAGENSKAVTVEVVGDQLDEADERFFVNLSSPVGATIADGQGEGTITDDDDPPAVSINDTTVVEGDAGTTLATFTVSLSEASGRGVAVGFATADDSAVAPGDYQSKTGTVSFAAGETSKTVTVAVNGDTVDEPDERFFVNLSNPQAATVGDGQGAGSITDDDGGSTPGVPAASISDVSVAEGDAGTTGAGLTVSLSEPSESEVRVGYVTADDSATAPGDYASQSGTVVFAPGDVSEAVTVAVKGDTVDEPDERFSVNLQSPVGASIADAQGFVTITDDDQPAPGVSIADTTVIEGDGGQVLASLTLSLSAPSAGVVSVGYASADGSAVAPGDYAATSGTVSFAAGETTKTVSVPVAGDALVEPDERFFVNLSSPQGATITDAQATATITDDDRPGRAGAPAVGAGERPGCVALVAGNRGGRLGPARLGRSRKAHRRALGDALLGSRVGIDSYCVAGGGTLRIGYPTRRLRRSLTSRAGRRLGSRAVLILTSSPRYSLRGIKPGTSTRALTRSLRGERRVRVGRIVWYLAPSSGGRLAFRTRNGKVLEVGLTNRRLTRTNRTAKRLLRAWQL